MTMTAGGPASSIDPGDAPAILREMAATVRAVFGVSLKAARDAAEPVAAVEAAPPAPPAAPVAPTSVAMPSVPSVPMPSEPLVAPTVGPAATATVAPAATVPASIPMPASIPVPDLTPIAETDELVAELVEDEPEPTMYVGEIPTLRVVPNPPTTNDVPAEHSHAVLREIAFLDD